MVVIGYPKEINAGVEGTDGRSDDGRLKGCMERNQRVESRGKLWRSSEWICSVCAQESHSESRESEAWHVYGGHYFSPHRFSYAEADGK